MQEKHSDSESGRPRQDQSESTSPDGTPSEQKKAVSFDAFIQGMMNVAFPATCIGCGTALPVRDKILCERCPHERFSDPNPGNDLTCEKLLLPEGILFQDALWKYDKGGLVNRIIHMLKYEGMGLIGTELGFYAGRRLVERHIEGAARFADGRPLLLLPVPLHRKREQKRGYNQARQIARGMQRATGIDLAQETLLIREKNTRTQTQFNLSQRMVNLKGAFKLRNFAAVRDRHVVIVDDVFTTGSTVFTVAQELQKAKPASVSVFTVAMA